MRNVIFALAQLKGEAYREDKRIRIIFYLVLKINDVSLDYIIGRTEKPQGKLYNYHPKIEQTSEEMRQFVEMCFDPNSPMNDSLKQTLLEMLGEEKK